MDIVIERTLSHTFVRCSMLPLVLHLLEFRQLKKSFIKINFSKSVALAGSKRHLPEMNEIGVAHDRCVIMYPCVPWNNKSETVSFPTPSCKQITIAVNYLCKVENSKFISFNESSLPGSQLKAYIK